MRLACQLDQCPVTAEYTDTNTKNVTESRHTNTAGAAIASDTTVAHPWIRRCVVAAAHQLWNRRRVEGDSSEGIGEQLPEDQQATNPQQLTIEPVLVDVVPADVWTCCRSPARSPPAAGFVVVVAR